MATFALVQLDEFEDDEQAVLLVRALTKHGKNQWNQQLQQLRRAGKKREVETLLRYIDDLRYGKRLPNKAYKPLGTRQTTGRPVHEGERELVVGQLRAYCIVEDHRLIVLFSAHIKKGKGGKGNTNQNGHINAMRDILRELRDSMSDLLS